MNTTLDYQPVSGRRSPRWLWRALVGLLCVFLVLEGYRIGVFHYAFQTWRYLSEARRLNKCMSYVAPADQVMWSEAIGPSASGPPSLNIAPPPQVWKSMRFRNEDPRTAMVFLHARSVQGKKYLVAIDYVPGRSGHGPHFASIIIEPGTSRQWPRVYSPAVAMDAPDWFAGAPKKLYAGQPDPQDDTRFTIRFETSDRKGELVGQLVVAGAGDYPRPATVHMRLGLVMLTTAPETP